MKNIVFTLITLVLVMVQTGCNQDDPAEEMDQNFTLSGDDAADVVGGALASASEGFSSQATESITAYEELSAQSDNPCGTTIDTTITKAVDLTNISANYSFSWSWMITCDKLVPQAFMASSEFDGSYETLRLSSNDQGDFEVTITGLVQGSEYLFNGSASRMGTQAIKVRNKSTFESTLALTFSDVAIDKSSKKVLSGTGTFLMDAKGSGGATQRIEGTFEFLGNEEVKIVINGEEYMISID